MLAGRTTCLNCPLSVERIANGFGTAG
ncbi:MAG: hypothetical protein J07HX64_01541 [halophilic archaeon J07HX64]|nr:MAG: hypothetical protein J07HX64_01541 [halophilic archaeon J07HX64]